MSSRPGTAPASPPAPRLPRNMADTSRYPAWPEDPTAERDAPWVTGPILAKLVCGQMLGSFSDPFHRSVVGMSLTQQNRGKAL